MHVCVCAQEPAEPTEEEFAAIQARMGLKQQPAGAAGSGGGEKKRTRTKM
jgi:hypothetical protein